MLPPNMEEEWGGGLDVWAENWIIQLLNVVYKFTYVWINESKH